MRQIDELRLIALKGIKVETRTIEYLANEYEAKYKHGNDPRLTMKALDEIWALFLANVNALSEHIVNFK
jgi:hypothetical protein